MELVILFATLGLGSSAWLFILNYFDDIEIVLDLTDDENMYL